MAAGEATVGVEARDGAHWDETDEARELLAEERYREALAELRRVLEANPQNAYAFHYTGVTLYEIGELEPARDAFRACLAKAPKHLGARVALAHVLRQLGQLREALKEGLAALSQAPGDGEALHAVGLAYHAKGDMVSARRYLDAFLETRPELEAALEVRTLLATMTAVDDFRDKHAREDGDDDDGDA
jgi:tetratricopeptide (TPR) repeat protein